MEYRYRKNAKKHRAPQNDPGFDPIKILQHLHRQEANVGGGKNRIKYELQKARINVWGKGHETHHVFKKGAHHALGIAHPKRQGLDQDRGGQKDQGAAGQTKQPNQTILPSPVP